MTEDAAVVAYREDVLALLTTGVGVVTLAAALLIFLVTVAVVRHF